MKRILTWLGLGDMPVPQPDLSSLPIPHADLIHGGYTTSKRNQYFFIVSDPSRPGFKILEILWDLSDWDEAGSVRWSQDTGSSIFADPELAADALMSDCQSRGIQIERIEPAG